MISDPLKKHSNLWIRDQFRFAIYEFDFLALLLVFLEELWYNAGLIRVPRYHILLGILGKGRKAISAAKIQPAAAIIGKIPVKFGLENNSKNLS